MDDLLTASKGGADHLQDLEQLLRRVIQHKLTLNVEKCEFFQKELQYLGFEVGGSGVRPGKPKIELLQKCPAPTSVTQIKQFLGLGNFFYRFVPFQREAKHLSVLTRKNSGWKGGPFRRGLSRPLRTSRRCSPPGLSYGTQTIPNPFISSQTQPLALPTR